MSYDEQDDGHKETLLQKAKRRIKASRDAFRAQRDREESDLRFQIPELQWDDAAKGLRSGGSVSGVMTPARPMLSVSKLDQPIQLVQNQARAAKLGVNIHPVSEKADKDTAEVQQGIYRRIEMDSRADVARLWGFDRSSKCGMGAWIVRTKYDENAPDTWDQEITIDRILYQSMVGFDPAAVQPDFSDGEFSWLGAYMTRETFKREFPKAKCATASDSEFEDMAQRDGDWFEGSGPDARVLVVEYFYKDHQPEEITTGKGENKRTRQRDKIKVRCAKITATDVLEDQATNGSLLPIIAVTGRELQPFDDQRRWVGMIGPAKDGQKLYNYAASTLVENMAMEPKAPYVGAEGQFEGHEDQWARANVMNFPYMEYKPVSIGGQPAPPPQRMQVDTSKMQLAMMALQEADQFIQATTAIYDPSLGRLSNREKSGRAILAAQSQSDAGTSHYVANLAAAVEYEARVVLDLMPHIYDRAGRIARILGGEDDDRTVMLNKSFVEGPDGMPKAVPDGTKGAKRYDLGKASHYAVSVNIGKSFQTRLEQGQTEIGEILSAQPALMPLLGATYFRFRDFPGAKEIADILKKVRDQQMPGLEEGKDGKPTVEQLQGQLAQVHQSAQQMQQQLQLAMEQIKTEQAKQQAEMMKAQLVAQTTLTKAEQDNAARIAVAQIGAGVKAGTVSEEAKIKERTLAEDHAFEFRQADEDRQHETSEHREEMAHEVALETAKQAHAARQQEASAMHEQDARHEQMEMGKEATE